MEGPHLTVMLTHHDITVPNAMDIFLEAKDAPADFWGFKDIGLPEREMRELVQCMKREGKTVFWNPSPIPRKRGCKAPGSQSTAVSTILRGRTFSRKSSSSPLRTVCVTSPSWANGGSPALWGNRRDHAHAREVSAQGDIRHNLSGSGYVGDAPALITGWCTRWTSPSASSGASTAMSGWT